jgi:hypothetical protein
VEEVSRRYQTPNSLPDKTREKEAAELGFSPLVINAVMNGSFDVMDQKSSLISSLFSWGEVIYIGTENHKVETTKISVELSLFDMHEEAEDGPEDKESDDKKVLQKKAKKLEALFGMTLPAEIISKGDQGFLSVSTQRPSNSSLLSSLSMRSKSGSGKSLVSANNNVVDSTGNGEESISPLSPQSRKASKRRGSFRGGFLSHALTPHAPLEVSPQAIESRVCNLAKGVCEVGSVSLSDMEEYLKSKITHIELAQDEEEFVSAKTSRRASAAKIMDILGFKVKTTRMDANQNQLCSEDQFVQEGGYEYLSKESLNTQDEVPQLQLDKKAEESIQASPEAASPASVKKIQFKDNIDQARQLTLMNDEFNVKSNNRRKNITKLKSLLGEDVRVEDR